MDTTTLVRELTHYGQDQIKVLGRQAGKLYLRRCLALWEEVYGPRVAEEVRQKLLKAWEAE